VGTTHVPDRRVTTAPYLALLLCGSVLYAVGQTAVPASVTVAGFQIGPLLLLASVVAAVVLWVPSRGEGDWRGLDRAWFVLVIILWLYLVVVESRDASVTAAAAVLIPLSVVLVWLKRPSHRDAWMAVDAFAWTVVIAAGVVLMLEVTDVIPSWYQRMTDASVAFDGLAAFDRDNHWLPLGTLLGLEGRWGGFLGDPNLIGPLAALLLVYGFARSGVRRIVFATSAAAMLVLADSRASFAAAAVGLALLVLLPGWGAPFRRVTAARAAAAGVAIAAGIRVLADVVASPEGALTMTGRTGMWPDFLSLWPESPWWGVGTARITEAVTQGILPPWSYHGHNQHIDMLVRYGVVGLALSSAVLIVALVISIGGARRGLGVGVALMGTMAVVTVANMALDWRYPSAAFSVLLAVIVLSATRERGQRLADSSSSVATSTTSTPSALPSP